MTLEQAKAMLILYCGIDNPTDEQAEQYQLFGKVTEAKCSCE